MADIFDMADTWNNAGTAFTAIKMNVTDTNSQATSLLLDLQVGGSSRAKIDKTGIGTFVGGLRVDSGGSEGVLQAASNILGFRAGTGTRAGVSSAGFIARNSNGYVWSSGDNVTATIDLALYRGAAGTLEQRNGLNAQASRLYFSYTDNANYTRLAFKTATGLHTIETESAGTGEANIDLALTPKGTGRVRFGTHAAIAAETITGYVTIKDAAGNSRKLAVVS